MRLVINLLSEFIGFLAMIGVVAFMACLAEPEKVCATLLAAPDAVREAYTCLFVVCCLALVILCVAAYFMDKRKRKER